VFVDQLEGEQARDAGDHENRKKASFHLFSFNGFTHRPVQPTTVCILIYYIILK
jgi:hypothetical protein